MMSRMARAAACALFVVGMIFLGIGCGVDSPTGSGQTPIAPKPTIQSGAPSTGTVVEGTSVPGIALGFTRAEVEAAYGAPSSCQSITAGDFASCSFPVAGGGQVSVLYRGADGGDASNSPDDVVVKVTWYEAVTGWETTAGVTTASATDNPDGVIAAYPDAVVTYSGFGALYSVIDYAQGIEVIWAPDFYNGTTHVQMAIFNPTAPPPVPEKFVHVAAIDLSANKVKGQREVRALVRVEDDQGQTVHSATVTGTWTLPDGGTQTVSATTSRGGYASFVTSGGPRGVYTFMVKDVVRDGFTFDAAGSTLTASINAK